MGYALDISAFFGLTTIYVGKLFRIFEVKTDTLFLKFHQKKDTATGQTPLYSIPDTYIRIRA